MGVAHLSGSSILFHIGLSWLHRCTIEVGMVHIPGARRPHFYERKWLVESVANVPPIVAAFVAAVVDINDPDRRITGWVLFGASVWLTAAAVLKTLAARTEDRSEERVADYEGLEGALQTLYSVVRSVAQLPPDADRQLRATVHMVVMPRDRTREPEEVEQMLPYIGGERTGKGRRLSIRSGVTGRAVRTKEPYKSSRRSDDYEGYIKELVEEWSFTASDARKVSTDRYAWLSIPIRGDKDTVVAVVYLDAASRGLFTEEVTHAALSAAAGMASFIRERYRGR